MPRTHAVRPERTVFTLAFFAALGSSPADAQRVPGGPGTTIPTIPANTEIAVPPAVPAVLSTNVDTGSVVERPRPSAVGALLSVGGTADERRRVRQLLGNVPLDGQLIRSASTLTPRPAVAGGGPMAQLLAPELRVVANSEIPFSLNDGAMWAGRGLNFAVSGGLRAALGPFWLVLAPQAVFQENRDFDVIPYGFRSRSRFAFPFPSHPRADPYSIDMPSRFGDNSFWTLDLGQSTLAADLGPVSVGASTEEQWWGPGVRNALVLSNQAAGVPHLFLRTQRPLQTRLGTVEGRWIVGALSESAYFDTIASNDTRSLSAAAVVLRPAFDTGLAVGFARAVYRPVSGAGAVPGRFLDAWLAGVGHPNERDPFDSTTVRGPDQVIALFARWVFPGYGFEAYAEWARRDFPQSLRDLLVYPHHGQGYTVGGQWARPAGSSSAFRIQAEATYVEQSAAIRQRPVSPWYLSRSVAQGYTQRGQVLGASIGPGSSSQWIATDWIASRWQAGLFAGRIRWQDDFHPNAREHPLNPTILNPTPFGHDVSVLGGVRGAARFGFGEIWGEYTGSTRFNYLFQHLTQGFEHIHAVDRRNHTFRLGVSPAMPW